MNGGNARIERAGERVFEDATFAQRILEGTEDFPEIKDAILADLAEARSQNVEDLIRTTNPAKDPKVLLDYIENGPKPGGMRVQHLIDQAQFW